MIDSSSILSFNKNSLVYFSTIAFLLLIVFQIFFSFSLRGDYLSMYGLIHLVWITSFFFAFWLCLKLNTKSIIVVITTYQLILVLALYTLYNYYYSSPLGPSPADDFWYHRTGLLAQEFSLFELINYVISVYGIADLGFPIVLKYVYMLPGDPILNMKFANVSFHIISTILVYKTGAILIKDNRTLKVLLIFYGLYPISIFFNSIGKKEPVFVLVSILTFYFLISFLFKKKSISNLLYFLIFLFLLGLFRIPYPLMVVASLMIYLFFFSGSSISKGIKVFTLLLVLSFLIGLIIILYDDIIRIISVNRLYSATHRLGTEPGAKEYLFLLISGFVGPFPMFQYEVSNYNYLLQTVPNFIKSVILSFFFLLGTYQILKRRLYEYSPLLIFVLLNILIFTIAAATLDHRLHYPFTPIYAIIAALGFSNFKFNSNGLVRYSIFLSGVIALIIVYNLL